MKVFTHDCVRLVAVILNIPLLVVGLYFMANMAGSAWLSGMAVLADPKNVLAGVFCLAPVFSLVAIMVKPEKPEADSN